jgi:uncharacterized membrane protein
LSALVPLALSLLAFVGTHFLMSHPLRRPMVDAMGEHAFQAVYSLISLLLFGLAIWLYRALGPQPPVWTAGNATWVVATVVMWFGSILFVGSFIGNPALPGATLDRGRRAGGVFAVTRHPMMWGFAAWALVHLVTLATPKAIVFDGAILFLALAGSVGQDRKKAARMGERWHEWAAQTAFVPFGRGLARPGWAAFLGGTALFLLATWAHGAVGGMPAGFWRWIG